MQEGRGETPCISSTDEVGELSKWLLLLKISDLKTKYEMEKGFVHTPSQRVQKLRQFVTHLFFVGK